MPARETVAGEALRRSSTSKWRVTFGRSMGMRSLLARVRRRLSSITVFMFSIQIASTGPSRTSHVKFFLSLFALRQSCAKMPSVHSLATMSSVPNIWPERMAFGFIVMNFCGWPIIGCTSAPGGTTIDWKRRLEHLDDARLARAGRADEHERVAHEAHLVDLDDLVHPVLVELQALLNDGLVDGRLDHRVLHLRGLEAGEEIVDEREEERHVLGDELGEVHVAEGTHHKHRLERAGLVLAGVALGATAGAQHREDVAEAEVVVRLLRELLLAETVEHVELLGAEGVLDVAGAGELDLHDNLTIGDHHRHATMLRLERKLGQRKLGAGVCAWCNVCEHPRSRRAMTAEIMHRGTEVGRLRFEAPGGRHSRGSS